jgi:hypothetical protein
VGNGIEELGHERPARLLPVKNRDNLNVLVRILKGSLRFDSLWISNGLRSKPFGERLKIKVH